ncbi:hypothetical protein Phi18:3_gp076 [Cellulophaga phage phi18:3]|uniref:Uncharacterized protein n=1 Tax=Cellulophaga phage phi18:3 TaxID=1327983 RepID=S0A344_9CAUD|nr:hypothetical protein Phi18:3_gp076 [Cellulophaga phage phi18:3]AGO48588.1 hypothetical protein Phi18:3_gp076 [Cellulophaga phage phi18:3]
MQKEFTTEELLDQHIKNKNGVIFNVFLHETRNDICYLRRANKYTRKNIREIKQGIVDGTWIRINEHELKKFMEEDNDKMISLTRKMVKRTIITQLLLEGDDELKVDYEDDKYFKSTLEKSNRECERIASRQFDKVYDADNVTSQNLMNAVDRVTTKLASLDISDYPFFENLIDDYFANREEHLKRETFFTKVD